MEKYQKLYTVISRIGGYPKVHLSQNDTLEFKIEIGGDFMEGFELLGDIQEEIHNELGNYFDLKTVYGDGQDATFIFTEK